MTKLGDGTFKTRVKAAVSGLLHHPHHHGDPKGVRVIGHRGAARYAPENTCASFQCAVDRGATAIEVDVCRTRDGRLVLWHDPDPREKITIARDLGEMLGYVANEPPIGSSCRKPISELTFDEFITHYGYTKRRDGISHILDGNTTPEVKPEPFEALLDFASKEPRLIDVFVDVKLRADQLDEARELARVIETSNERARTPTRFHLLSAEVEVLEALREASIELRVYGDFELPGVLKVAHDLDLRCISMGCGQRLWASFHKELIEVLEARDRGEVSSVIVWTINQEDRLRALVDAGVDGIITDDPDLLCDVIRQPSVAR
jgi:glycerophosphoryl diester phosphodiesterase